MVVCRIIPTSRREVARTELELRLQPHDLLMKPSKEVEAVVTLPFRALKRLSLRAVGHQPSVL